MIAGAAMAEEMEPRISPWAGGDDLDAFLVRPSPFAHASLLALLVLLAGAFVLAYAVRVEQSVRAVGTLRPEGEAVAVSLPAGGMVTELRVREGDVVRQGALLARLDDRQAGVELASVEARLRAVRAEAEGVARAESALGAGGPAAAGSLAVRTGGDRSRSVLQSFASQVRLAETEKEAVEARLERERELARRGFASAEALERLEAEHRSAVLRMEALRAATRRDLTALAAELERESDELTARANGLRTAMETLRLDAPVAGVVSNLAIDRPQQYLPPGQRLLSLLPARSELVVETFVSARDRARVRTGQPAAVRFEALRHERFSEARGTVASIAPDVALDAQGRPLGYRVRVRLDAPVPGARLEPGMNVSVRLIAEEARAIHVLFRRFG